MISRVDHPTDDAAARQRTDEAKAPTIDEVNDDTTLVACLPVIRAAFRTVMDDLDLTEADAPTNAAFLTEERLLATRQEGTRLFAARVGDEIVGCVAMRAGGRPGIAYLEKLAVAPPYRHHGYGEALMDHALAVAAASGATVVSIGIIDENTRLKRWYERYGFVATATRRFDHLPFTVCFMQRSTRRQAPAIGCPDRIATRREQCSDHTIRSDTEDANAEHSGIDSGQHRIRST